MTSFANEADPLVQFQHNLFLLKENVRIMEEKGSGEYTLDTAHEWAGILAPLVHDIVKVGKLDAVARNSKGHVESVNRLIEGLFDRITTKMELGYITVCTIENYLDIIRNEKVAPKVETPVEAEGAENDDNDAQPAAKKTREKVKPGPTLLPSELLRKCWADAVNRYEEKAKLYLACRILREEQYETQRKVLGTDAAMIRDKCVPQTTLDSFSFDVAEAPPLTLPSAEQGANSNVFFLPAPAQTLALGKG